jgi:hypothetical protein
MNWNDWEIIWRHQELPVGAGADLAILRQTFEAKRRKLQLGLLLRNVSEGFGGVFMSTLVMVAGWRFGAGGWRLGVGTTLIFGVSLVFVFDFFRAHRLRLTSSATLLARIEAEISELRHQRRLIANIGTWYFLPYIGAFVLIGSALGDVIGRTVLHEILTTPAALRWIITILTFGYGATWCAWRAHVKVIRNGLNPRLAELEKLRRDILSSE